MEDSRLAVERHDWAALAEPYRIKVTERIRLPDRAEREALLAAADYLSIRIDAADVFIDLTTDSGTGAMSDNQWAALLRGDESYFGSRSYLRFEAVSREVTGYPHIIPTHQGRAAEKILTELLVRPGDIVLGNTHFDTTRGHILHRQGVPVDCVGDLVWDFSTPGDFKGNFDLKKLELALERHHTRVPFILITVVNNMACSAPVSMENIRGVKKLADQYGVMVLFDACRVAENAYFIQQREPEFADAAISDIVLEMFSYGDGCWVSAKKDANVNIGGFFALRDEVLATRAKELLVLHEGYPTYGGLAGRDLEAMAVGLHEAMDQEYLAHRIRQTAYLGKRIAEADVTVSMPTGGSGVFIDAASIYPHLSAEQLPAVAFAADMYLEGGIRIGGSLFTLKTIDVESGEIVERPFALSRLAIPRRTYTQGHLEYVANVVAEVKRKAPGNKGYRITYLPETMGHFFIRFAPLG
ncbi:tryptophanase [Acrocarpospora catenulata]|uniref:tryptophanase n=1 Tax=Acrocarpospora catenulata TaxID=2836182 RepID=UPI001BDAB9B0|nr:tryptophanase [Acrocarpospora catenulata]